MATDAEILEGDELAVARWRTEQLLALGMDEDTAGWLANGDMSWHDADDLLKHGCPPELVVRILG